MVGSDKTSRCVGGLLEMNLIDLVDVRWFLLRKLLSVPNSSVQISQKYKEEVESLAKLLLHLTSVWDPGQQEAKPLSC